MPDGPRGPLTPSGPPLGGDRDIAFRRPRSWWRRHLSGLIAVVVVVVVIGGIAAVVLATRNLDDVSAADPSDASSSAVPSASASTKPSPTTTPKPPPIAPKTTATGTVVAVIASGHWTLAVQKGLQLTVIATPATTYARGRSADDVKKNSMITVVGTLTNGVITAQTVTIAKKKSAT